MSTPPSPPRPLSSLREHIDQWGGLNATDARQLLDLIDGTAGTETAIQAYDEPMRPDMPAERMEILSTDRIDTVFGGDRSGIWVRLVTDWRPA